MKPFHLAVILAAAAAIYYGYLFIQVLVNLPA